MTSPITGSSADTRLSSRGNQNGGRLTHSRDRSQVSSGARIVDLERVAAQETGEQQRLSVLGHQNRRRWLTQGDALHSLVGSEVVYPHLCAGVLVRREVPLMDDCIEASGAAIESQILQAAGTPVLRALGWGE